MVWVAGYDQGAFEGHVYDDACRGLHRWRERGLALAVYSSGSVKAQHLLFGHSCQGDLRPLFSGWFDTRVGGKKEAASYVRIAEQLGAEPGELLFLSDAVTELDAAAEAGWHTCWLVRDGGEPAGQHPQAIDFDEFDRLL